MARIRTIKPEFPHSESMGRVSRDARLCFILIWTLADDSGRLRGNSRMLASLLFPYDDDAPKHIDKWLLELERESCIVRYQADGQSYLQVLNWLNHQKIDKPTPSKIPSFDESSRILANPLESSHVYQGVDQGVDQVKDHSEAWSPREYLDGLGVDPQVVMDWLKLRKKKKAEVTLTAIQGIENEACQAFISLEDALRYCCQQGWQGFKAEWLKGQKLEYKSKLDKLAETGASLGGYADKPPIDGSAIEIDRPNVRQIPNLLRNTV